MNLSERIAVIETKIKNLERLLYGIIVLLAANLGVNIL